MSLACLPGKPGWKVGCNILHRRLALSLALATHAGLYALLPNVARAMLIVRYSKG